MILGEEFINKVHCSECLSFMKTLPENFIDSVITDPPYGLRFMGKKWDYEIPKVDVFEEMLRVAKPGAILMCFGGTRTWHRIAVNIEDAGWEIRDTIMWVYGSGFPKSLNIGKQIDSTGRRYEFFDDIREFLSTALKNSKYTIREINEIMGMASNGSGMAGHWFANITQQTLPTKKQWFKLKDLLGFDNSFDVIFNSCVTPNERPVIGKLSSPARSIYGSGIMEHDVNITAPATEESAQWEGYGTSLKPAWEPIIVAMKPLDRTYAENALKWGVAGLNIDGGRVNTDENITNHSRGVESAISKGKYGDSSEQETHQTQGQVLGRFPANLIHDGSEEVVGLFPQSKGQQAEVRGTEPSNTGQNGIYGRFDRVSAIPMRNDSGSAARFFYCAKSSRSERENGLSEFPEKEVAYSEYREAMKDTNSYVSKYPDGSPRPMNKTKNNHPTVKPLALMEYLCKLTRTPTGGIVLDPYAGSGTTGIACIRTNRQYILIEKEQEYYEVINKRIKNEFKNKKANFSKFFSKK